MFLQLWETLSPVPPAQLPSEGIARKDQLQAATGSRAPNMTRDSEPRMQVEMLNALSKMSSPEAVFPPSIPPKLEFLGRQTLLW